MTAAMLDRSLPASAGALFRRRQWNQLGEDAGPRPGVGQIPIASLQSVATLISTSLTAFVLTAPLQYMEAIRHRVRQQGRASSQQGRAFAPTSLGSHPRDRRFGKCHMVVGQQPIHSCRELQPARTDARNAGIRTCCLA